ncbi:hypothetical protein RLIN73S_01541 [Rhodanobacter lindaniclasticus]
MDTDGKAWAGWALREQGTEQIALATVCDTEREALELRRQMKVRQPHRPRHKVVMVEVTVRVVD